MVATDVASRGIGMIEIPLPHAATPSRLYSSYLALNAQALSRLRYFARVLSCLLVLSHTVSWNYACSIFRATLVILNSVLFRVQDMELASLDLIKLSPRLPNQRTWMCESPTLALNRNGQLMSEAERVLDAFKCSFFTSRPGSLLYHFSCSC